jgi:hypothetical protein
MYYFKQILSLARFVLTKPTVLLLFLTGLYCLSVGLLIVFRNGF